MKITKSLLLGAAAGLMAVSGAQAADLPLKAKAVEYVKICSLYGAGFYYIPGTDTCIKLGGYLRADYVFNTQADYDAPTSGTPGAHNRLSNYYTWRSRADLNIDTRTATEYGLIRTYFDGVYSWTTGNYTGAGSTAVNGATAYTTSLNSQVGTGLLGVYAAFIQFAGFTMGKAVSQFSAPWANYPGNVFDGMPGAGSAITGVNQFSYTFDFGQGITASVSAQDQTAYYQTNIWNVSGATAAGLATGVYGASDFGATRSPDLVAAVRVDQAWGLFQASFAAHDNHAGYYGADETTGHPGDKWGWAAQLALSIKNIPTGAGDTINMSAVYTNGASRYDFHENVGIAYAIYGGTSRAGAYQSLGFGGVSDSVFVAGSGQELTTTYGFQGAYTHNWDPKWNTAIYGGLGAVRYNGTAKGYMCGAVVATLALSTGLAGCNPDFSYGVIGTVTRWTPVKNLTFMADIAYVMLDQKYASGSTVTLPLQAGIAKPAATYELKDQGALALLLRAQRNW